jgi:hypothetical protein
MTYRVLSFVTVMGTAINVIVPASPTVTVELCVTVVEIVQVFVDVWDFREVIVGICRTEEQYPNAP